MSIFGNLKTEGLEESQDRLGGFSVKPTDVYECKIKMAYAGQSASGARNVTLILDTGNSDYTETVYITNKAGENFFLNQNDKTKKVPLPGFTTIDDLCIVTTDKPLAQQDTEEKIVNVYDYEKKKDVPTSVPVLVDLIGKEVYVGIVSQTVNKNEKDDSGNYQPTAETREENVIEKIFHHPTKITVPEARSGSSEATFYEAWVAKNKGVTRDRRKIKDGQAGGSGAPRTGKPGGGTAQGGEKKTSSLFGK